MRLSHPIFRTPLAPDLGLVARAQPEGYRDWLDGLPLAATIEVWRVQQGELGVDLDHGEVVDPYGFEDSPDCEWISGGVNSKGPAALAIGRQANRFFWGFSGDPLQMTTSARQVFLNAIVWIDRYDGQSPLEPEREVTWIEGRESTLIDLGLYLEESKRDADSSVASHYRSKLPPELLAEPGVPPEQRLASCRARLEQLVAVVHGREISLSFDPILVREGASNRKLEFFDVVARLLEGDAAAQQEAATLLDRYVGDLAPRDPQALRAWVVHHRERLYFSDRFGYRWRLAPTTLAPRGR